jgi:hypothetical protein
VMYVEARAKNKNTASSKKWSKKKLHVVSFEVIL